MMRKKNMMETWNYVVAVIVSATISCTWADFYQQKDLRSTIVQRVLPFIFDFSTHSDYKAKCFLFGTKQLFWKLFYSDWLNLLDGFSYCFHACNSKHEKCGKSLNDYHAASTLAIETENSSTSFPSWYTFVITVDQNARWKWRYFEICKVTKIDCNQMAAKLTWFQQHLRTARLSLRQVVFCQGLWSVHFYFVKIFWMKEVPLLGRVVTHLFRPGDRALEA